MKFLSLFSGAGGLDLGLESAGWDCCYASDFDPEAVASIEKNKGFRLGPVRAFSNAFTEIADVRHLTGTEILQKAGVKRGEVQLLAGGPPCQSWSSAGHQQGFKDPRGQLFSDFIRIANQTDVRWILFENVRGLLTARGPDGVPGSALAMIREKLLSKGFQTTVHLLNAADFGLPQRRVRLFVIGYRDGDPPLFPMATHAKPTERLESRQLKAWVAMRDALINLTPLADDEIIRPTGKLARELSKLSPGSGVKSPGKAESTRPGGHWGYKQGAFVADLDLPSRTVTANAQQDWIVDPALGLRRLCPRECAALQSFPAKWLFVGTRSTQYRLIGNAVPPRLARVIGASLLAHAGAERATVRQVAKKALLPLPEKLDAAIRYTIRDEARNGASRRLAPQKRSLRVAV